MHRVVHKCWSIKGDMIIMHGIQNIQIGASVLTVALFRINLTVRHHSGLNTLLHGNRSQYEA
jgi:hypothetical protein